MTDDPGIDLQPAAEALTHWFAEQGFDVMFALIVISAEEGHPVAITSNIDEIEVVEALEHLIELIKLRSATAGSA